MTYKELKKHLGTFSEEQLGQNIIVIGKNTMMEKIRLEVLEEDFIYNLEYPDEGCFPKSKSDKWGTGDDESNYGIAMKKGDVILTAK